MPKLKTHRGAAKRIKRTKNGKFLCHKAGKRHLLESKSSKTKRHARSAVCINDANIRSAKQLLPYG